MIKDINTGRRAPRFPEEQAAIVCIEVTGDDVVDAVEIVEGSVHAVDREVAGEHAALSAEELDHSTDPRAAIGRSPVAWCPSVPRARAG